MGTSEIRVLQFNQGVGVALPPTSADISNKVSLPNNTATDLTDLTYDITKVSCVEIDYYIYRKTSAGYKIMKGLIAIMACADGATNADKWTKEEMLRVEKFNDSGVTFSLSFPGTGQFNPRVTLDNMSGTGHVCTMYYNISTKLA